MHGRGSFRKIKSLLMDKAPEIARFFTGSFAGTAVDVVAQTVLGRPETDESVLVEALSAASPEVILELRRAGLALQSELIAAGVDMARVHQADRANARSRQIALKDRVPGALAFVVVAGFFGVLAVMLFSEVPTGAETEFSIMLGALATMAAAVMNYYFGSSAGSREKTHLLENRPPRSSFTDGLPKR